MTGVINPGFDVRLEFCADSKAMDNFFESSAMDMKAPDGFARRVEVLRKYMHLGEGMALGKIEPKEEYEALQEYFFSDKWR